MDGAVYASLVHCQQYAYRMIPTVLYGSSWMTALQFGILILLSDSFPSSSQFLALLATVQTLEAFQVSSVCGLRSGTFDSGLTVETVRSGSVHVADGSVTTRR